MVFRLYLFKNKGPNSLKKHLKQSCHCRNARRSITGSPWSCKAIGRKLLAFRRNGSPRDIKSIAQTLSGLTGKITESGGRFQQPCLNQAGIW